MKMAGDSQDALESPWGGSRDAPVRLLRRPKGSWESPGRLQGGSREAFATPPVAPRSLPSGSREAFGRRQTQSRHFGGSQGGPGAARDPQEPPKRPMSAPIRGHCAPRECLKQEWRSEGCFSQKVHGASTGSTFWRISCCYIDPKNASVSLRQARTGVKCRSPGRAPGT